MADFEFRYEGPRNAKLLEMEAVWRKRMEEPHDCLRGDWEAWQKMPFDSLPFETPCQYCNVCFQEISKIRSLLTLTYIRPVNQAPGDDK